MIILLGKDSTYQMDADFPMFSLPVTMEGATTQSLSDFQWWAYSSDFQKWLKQNPRQWTADSENMSKYGSLEDFIKENFEHRIEFCESDSVLGYDDYDGELFEDEKGGNEGKQILKFAYAYHQLLSEGKIQKEFQVASQKEGEEKALFLSADDDKGQELPETITAFKITKIPTSGNSKMALFRISEMLPGGKISDDDNSETVFEKVSNTAIKALAYTGAGLVAYWTISKVGGLFASRLARKKLLNLLPKKPGDNFARLRKIAANRKKVKSLFRYVDPRKALGAAKAVGRGISGAYKAATKGKAGFTGTMKAFGKGTSRGLSKAGIKGAAEWVPVVGWVLAAVDVVGSTWNWFSDNQAPRFSEIDSFAKNEFVPQSIPVGVPITICWSQEAGGAWGNVINFIANNDTRTTMELVKIGDFNGKTIFILAQINSKELGKQLAEHDLTLIAFNSSEKVETGILDNDDLDFEISTIDQIGKLSVMYNFKGVCDWSEIYTAYEAASDQLFISDPDAPKKYRFYFEDSDGEKINVSGNLITDEQLAKFADSDYKKYFGDLLNVNEGEYLNLDWDKNVLESENILSFEDFSSKAFTVNEEDETQQTEVADNLAPAEMTGPKKVAIYLVEEKQYANPNLRGTFETGDFKDFVVDPQYWKVKDGTKIDVLVDTDEILEDPIKGIFTWQDEGKEIEDEGKKKSTDTSPEDRDKEDEKGKEGEGKEETGEKIPDDYYITVDPDDVRIKQRERSTTIRDFNVSGGLNPFDKFLTPRQKEILGIDTWKQITFAKEFLDKRGDIIEVKLKNKFAPFGDRTRKYRVVDGEAFEVAKKFVEETRDRIKYE